MEPVLPTLGRYTLERELGRGGMGVVYAAREERLERLVALKLIAPELASDARFRERFVREARLAASLEHPGIVPIYAADEEDGRLFIAMRLVSGGDLASLLQTEGALRPERAFSILSPIADALDAAHAQGLVHRDVKPGNILVESRPGTAPHGYLSDFGLAREHGRGLLTTRSSSLLGTVEYMAPEQVSGEPVDGRGDQYALACVLFHALCGRTPFAAATKLQVLVGHLESDPPRPSTLRPELPAALDDAVLRAMAKSPGDRYPTCAAFLERARQPVAGAAWRRRLRGAGAAWRRRLRRPTAALVAALAVGAAAALAWRESRAPDHVLAAGGGSVWQFAGRPGQGGVAVGAAELLAWSALRPDGVVHYRDLATGRRYRVERRGAVTIVVVRPAAGAVPSMLAEFADGRLRRGCYRPAARRPRCSRDPVALATASYAGVAGLRSVAFLEQAAPAASLGDLASRGYNDVVCAGAPDGSPLLCVGRDGVVTEARFGGRHLVRDDPPPSR